MEHGAPVFWGFLWELYHFIGFPGGSMVKNPSAMQKMQVWSLGWEDPLEEGMVTHSSILSWESHGQRSLMGYSHGVAKSQTGLKWLSTGQHTISSHVPLVKASSILLWYILNTKLFTLLLNYQMPLKEYPGYNHELWYSLSLANHLLWTGCA